MKKATFALSAILAAGFVLSAQESDNIEAWMHDVDTAAKVMRKLEKKTGPEVVAHAEKVGSAYEKMIGFWRQRNAEDAVKLSETGKAAAVELASAAKADDAEKANAAWTKIGGTCRGCHEAHREKTPEGKYQVK